MIRPVTGCRRVSLLALAVVGISSTAQAATDAWLIGGGNFLDNSQGQIEQNVLWLDRLLQPRVQSLSIYYAAGVDADGKVPQKDVVFWAPPAETSAAMQPLARVFAPVGDNGKNYKFHEVQGVRGSTAKDSLVPALTRDFAAVKPGDDILLVYNGHGGGNSNTSLNHLKLWGEQTLAVGELSALFNKAPASSTVRFLMTQCYSGGFQKLIFEQPDSRRFNQQKRCGFMAESAWRESEGCALGINKEDFRDYTTYFFAALSGSTRLDTVLPTDPDLNHDGKVSYREAHLYTLQTAVSTDLSRATSEVFLEEWQPWFVRWDNTPNNPDSEYWHIAEQVAASNHLTLDSQQLWLQQRELERQMRASKAQQEALLINIGEEQKSLHAQLAAQWPELRNPYTLGYVQVIRNDLDAVQDSILAQPQYADLKASQDQYLQLQQQELELERHFTQIEKVLRMKKLARLQVAFQRYASIEERQQYQQLLSCEEGVLE